LWDLLDSCYFVNFSGEDIFIMSEALKNLQQYVGRSEMATDMVTASAIVKLAATLGVKNPASAKGDPIPPGWHGSFFPASHRPTEMRADVRCAPTDKPPAEGSCRRYRCRAEGYAASAPVSTSLLGSVTKSRANRKLLT
jgi:hypothetical protein